VLNALGGTVARQPDNGEVGLMAFRVRVWCNACRDDDEGCFGGGSAILDGYFETRDEAHKAAAEYCGNLPYGYRIEQSDERGISVVPAMTTDRNWIAR
jgi:hypothetical protein